MARANLSKKSVPAPADQGPTPTPYSDGDQPDKGTVVQDGETSLSFDDALKLFNDAKKYVDNGLRKRWDNYYKVYRGARVNRNYEGIADPVNREAHTIIETLVANIAGGDTKFHFVKTNEEQTGDVEVLNGMLDYYLKCNSMGLKQQEWVREMLLYGTGILHVWWEDGKPRIEVIAIRDFFVDPVSTGLVNTSSPARYAGFTYLASKDTLKKTEIYSAEQNKYVPKYKNLDKLSESNETADSGDQKSTDKKFKDDFNSSTLGNKATEDQVFVIRLYDLTSGRMIEIGNRKTEIYNDVLPYQREESTQDVQVEVEGEYVSTKRTLDAIDPFLPFAALRDYIDSSLFYGEGEMEVLMSDAELLNDYEAMDIDNNAYQNTPMYWIDPQFADLAPEIETIPGAVYPIPRNAMGALERPQLSADLDNKKAEIMARMRRSTAADEAIQGVAQDKGRITATEVSTQLAQAQGRFSTKIQNMENEGFSQLASVIFKMIQVFVTTKTAVRIVGKQGTYFKDYDPWEFNGEWEPHVELDSTIKSTQLEVGQKLNQVFEVMKDSPIYNPVEVQRFIVQHIDPEMTDEKFNAMLAPPTPPQPKDPAEFINASYKDLEPWARYQIQKKWGIEPDPQLLGDIHNRMLEQGNQGADHLNPTTDASGAVIPGMDSILNPQPAKAPGDLAPAGA